MVRASRLTESSDSNSDDLQATFSSQISRKRATMHQPTSSILSPASSVSPDKENEILGMAKNTEQASISSPESSKLSQVNNLKRPVEQENSGVRVHRRRTVEAEDDNSDDNYDPDQDIEERRMLRKGLRDLNKNLVENRSEFLNLNSTGLEQTITQANTLSRQVKQTSDATIDSNLLVVAADITYKRTVAIISGESGQGVDLDEFINKCKLFMRQGDDERVVSTSDHDLRVMRDNSVDEDEDQEDEILNWDYLGRHACAQNVGRPCVPGFLLGPLSTEKKAKRVMVRKAALRISSMKESRPEVLREEDIVHDEDFNLSTMCQKITTRLEKVRGDAITAAELETRDDMTDKEAEALLDKHSLSREAGIALFKFVINPNSFSQSIENLFYVSFLIRDGKMAVTLDDRGLPYLELRDDSEVSNEQGGPTKHQAVLTLDMASWKELIKLYNIKEPMIRHREDAEIQNVGAKGWYA